MNERSFRYAPLTHANAHRIGKRLVELLAAKRFVIASVTLNDLSSEIKIQTDEILRADWVDKSNNLVRVGVEDEHVSIHFSDGHNSYIYLSRQKDGYFFDNFKTPYFAFDHNEVSIRQRVCNNESIRVTTIRVIGDLPWDTEAYYERELIAHYEAANLPFPPKKSLT